MSFDNSIYVPIGSVEQNKRRLNGDYSNCTKLNFNGYQISIASDQSLCADKDLDRSEIRVYTGENYQEDVTGDFVKEYNKTKNSDLNIFTSTDDLMFIMNSILLRQNWKLLKDTTQKERSWAEDTALENGHYTCECIVCLRTFTGHKRRVVCKSCHLIEE